MFVVTLCAFSAPEEERDNRRLILDATGRSIRHYVELCERIRDVTLEDLADATTIPRDEWRGLIEGKPSDDVTVEQAEGALSWPPWSLTANS